MEGVVPFGSDPDDEGPSHATGHPILESSIMSTDSRRSIVDSCLARIRDPNGEGMRTFTRIYDEAARLAADTADRMESLGIELPPLAGLPISIKDLFDVKGEPTLAGSRVLADADPAAQDAEVVRRLRQAGAAIIGKTNMTEFAFSGLGLNPHYGTPLNAWDRAGKRIPGGSSSGAAISITDGMALAAIGTDTGGSCRIPAAFNGLVGMKPSAQTVPVTGALPLSSSYDSVGPLAATVEICARVYDVLAGHYPRPLRDVDPRSLTLGVVTNTYVLDDMDPTVGATYDKTLARLADAGVRLLDVTLTVIDELPALFSNGGLVAAEAYQWHRKLLATQEAAYDPRVSVRIKRGSLSSAADYAEMVALRQRLIAKWTDEIAPYDALVMPTLPVIAPTVAELADDESYGRINLLVLRNPTTINALDGCALSIPCHAPGDAPVGLTLACSNGNDHSLLAIAKTLQSFFV
jgi:aspartyl-tRNA(Asn)/glutamyl-tRNA(Gln) amidotransferase subunit A